MAHASQERYSALVDAKLRATLVTRDNTIFNNRYEGSPKAGSVKVPVRDTEVAVNDYNKQTGAELTGGDTTYLTVNIDKALEEAAKANPWAFGEAAEGGSVRVSSGAEHGTPPTGDTDAVTAAFKAMNPGIKID